MKLKSIIKKINELNESVSFDTIFDNLGQDNGLDQLQRGYSGFNDDEDEMIDTESDEFRDYVYEVFEELYQNLYDYITSSNITLWRYISVDEQGLQKILNGNTSLGIYWTYDKNSAQQYFGDTKKYDVVLESKVKNSDINWIKTFTVKLEIDQTDEEKEIRLKTGADIKLSKCIVNKNDMVKKIKNNKFNA